MPEHETNFTPEDFVPNVVFSLENAYITEEDQEKLKDSSEIVSGKGMLLCRACGWNTYHERTSYLPRLRIFHTRTNSGLWEIGSDYLMWDRPGDRGMQTNDYMTWKFLREQGTKIPLVEEMFQLGKEGDQFQYTIMSRAKGKPLEAVYRQLTRVQRRYIADQLIAALRDLRQHTAPAPQRVDGSPLWDNILGQCWGERMCKTIRPTKEEWLDSLDEELCAGIAVELPYGDDKTATVDSRLQELRNNFPENGTFVLTHADLNLGNIIVDPDTAEVVAIVDWEHAGYYPWWVERWTSWQRNISGDITGELFSMVWQALYPEQKRKEFIDKVASPVGEVSRAYQAAPVEHTQSHDVWLKPVWCECRPYKGHVHRANWDAEMKHEIVAGQEVLGKT